jgi:outer membrane biosynthesis protein TonB
MAGRYGAWYPWLLLICGAVVSVTANAIQAAMTPDLAVPHALAATAASIPPIVLLAVTHLTVVLSRPAGFKPSKKRKHVTPPVEAAPPVPVLPPMPPAPSEEWAAPPIPATAPPPVWTPPPPPTKTEEPAPEPEQEITGQARDDEEAPDAAKAAEGAPGGNAAEVTDAMADDALRALIADIRRDTGTEAAGPVRGTSRTSLMGQASGLKAEGLSNKEIGQRLGVDPTTVGRWLRQLANGAVNA